MSGGDKINSSPATFWSGALAFFLLGVADVLAGSTGNGLALGLLIVEPTLLLLLGGALSLLAAWLIRRIEAIAGSRPGVEIVAAIVVAFPWLAHVSAMAFVGRRARELPMKSLLQLTLLAGGVIAVAIGAKLCQKLRARVRATQPTVGWRVVLVLTAVGCVLADRNLLVRLYPFFHASLEIVAVICTLLVASTMHIPAVLRRPTLIAAIGGGMAALLAILALPSLRARAAEGGLIAFVGFLHTAAPHEPPVAREQPARSLPPGPRLPGRDVVLITVDALRADHLGTYGYPKKITPQLDRLAAESVVFERAYAATPHTSFSLASLLTGRHVHARTSLGLRERHDTLPELLRSFRIKTAGFYPPAVFFIDRERLVDFETSKYGFEYVKFEFMKAHGRHAQIESFLAKDAQGKQFFLWVHYFEPHEPYVKHSGFDFGDSAEERYDSEIGATDDAIGRLIARVRQDRPDCIIIVSADHGEEFGDHGGHYHGRTLYEEQIRVPLIIHVPEVDARRIRTPVSTVDIAPTVLSLLDIPPPAHIDGTDLGPWLSGSPPTSPTAHPAVFAEVFERRMAVRGAHKLICDARVGLCQLYDLDKDPSEKNNLVDAQPARVDALRRELRAALDAFSQGGGGDPLRRSFERARLGDKKALAELGEVVRSSDLETARRAAKLFFEIADSIDPASIPSADHPDIEVRDRIQIAATIAGKPDARRHVRSLLLRPDLPPELRFQSALSLAAQGDDAGRAVLIDVVVNNSEFDPRRQAVFALMKLRDRKAVPSLISVMPEVRMRRLAVEALGVIGDRRATRPIARRIHDDPYISIRKEMAIALGKIGDRSAVPVLRRLVATEPEASVVRAAEEALTELGD